MDADARGEARRPTPARVAAVVGAVVAGLVSYPVMLWLAPVVGLAVLSTEHRRRRSVAGLAAVAFVTALLTALFVFAEASSLRLEVGG